MKGDLLLLDVTAMAGDAVCVAGIDLGSGTTVRLNDPQPTTKLLQRIGGLAPGDRIHFDGERRRKPEPPHVEDARWKPESVRKAERLQHDALVEHARKAVFPGIRAAFGEPAARGRNGNHVWKPGSGERSLATVELRYVRFEWDERDRLRVAMKDTAGDFWNGVPFQDLIVRRHETECRLCASGHVRHVRRDFEANACLVRVGLTRPFEAEAGKGAGCWLQVTNILARPRGHFGAWEHK